MSAVMSAAGFHRDHGDAPAAVLSVLVHAILLSFLFFGIRWQSKLPDAVVVELWDRPAVMQPPALPRVETPKPEPKVEPEPKPVKPDIAVEKKPLPKKKEPPKKTEPAIKFDRNAAIREQLTRETGSASSANKAAQSVPAGPVVDASYANKIKAKIKGNLVLPAGITGNPEAIFDVIQLPTGEVLSARLRKSSGHDAYDQAVERAILKSTPLPRPDRPDQFARELQFKFRPVE